MGYVNMKETEVLKSITRGNKFNLHHNMFMMFVRQNISAAKSLFFSHKV